MNHKPFLKIIAEHYSHIDNSNDYCFVFPNHRSIKFFNDYIGKEHDKVIIARTSITITDFISEFTDDILATPIELIFTLYQAYQEVTGNDTYEFDKFVYWSKIIVDDFNDIDLYMADAKQVLTYVAEMKSIATNYYDENVKKALEYYLNVVFESSDDETFWVKNKFQKLWQILYPLYVRYNQKLEEKGLSYTGKISKHAAEKITQMEADQLPYKKYVFVGFNVLSKSEYVIFDSLKKKNIAEFCWDSASPAFRNKNNKGTLFLNNYLKKFGNTVELDPIENFTENINVISVPARVGMAKYAFQVVNNLIDENKINNVNTAVDTAIVLPDEQLFPYLLNSISGNIKNVNATLGYPLQKSDIATLMTLVAKMHKNASRTGEQKEYSFYKDFVREVLTHPLLVSLFGMECTKMMNKIDHANIFNIPESMFADTKFEPLFITIKDLTNKNDVIEYIDRIIGFCDNVRMLQEEYQKKRKATEDDESISLQNAFMLQYIEVLNEIKHLIDEFGVPMCESTVFYLITRLTTAYTIRFEGEPLKYLQMMGMLETRNMDFKNLIVLSMNERVFPRKFFKSSFIPKLIRKEYGMSTTDQQESMMAYYFFRLLARSENVYLIYDSSTNGISSYEYSRFISQLKRLYNCKIKFGYLSSDIKPSESIHFEITKDSKISKSIDAYFTEGSEKFLSASSIKEYLKCPLCFYFHHIEKLDKENEPSEFIDSATFGTIVHDTLQEFYYPDNMQWKHHRVTKSMIKVFKEERLYDCLLSNLYKTYLHKKYVPGEEPTGETTINMMSLKLYAENVLNYDINCLDKDDDFFEVYECEKTYKLYLKVSDSLSFNFNFKADRIDKINGKGPLRIIDYKTGGDETSASPKDIFNPRKPKKHAILQLMLYCMAYSQEHPEEDAIKPIIYKILDMDSSEIKIDKEPIMDYKQFNTKSDGNFLDFFKVKLEELINSLKNHDTPFVQCEEKDQSPCSYCNFAAFCRR